jgi:hypothetical protein
MVKRQCIKCKAIFERKSHYDYHINRKFDCTPNSIILNNNSQNYANLQKITENYKNQKNQENQVNQVNNQDIEIFSCSYCQKNFSTKYTLIRHMNDSCKAKKENDNEKENIFKMLLERDKRIEKLEKQNQLLMNKIDKLISMKEISNQSKIIKNSNNTTTNNDNSINNKITNNTQNIVMMNFGKEDLSIIDEKQFIDRVVKKPLLSGVKIPDEVLKIIHFNPQYPQLSNIYISDINREKCMVYEDGEWKLSSVDNIPQIIDKVCIFSSEQINLLRTKYPNNKQLNDRLNILEKYNNLIDVDHLEDLKDENVDGSNLNQITRCEEFQKYTYDTMKKTLYNEGKKLKKKY